MVSEFAPTLPYFAVSCGTGRGVRGKRDLRCCFYHPPWQLLGWRLGWKDCCCCWLWLDLLAISRMLCSVAVSGVMLPTVPDLAGKNKPGMERNGPAPSAFRRAGWRLALRKRHRKRTCCCCGTRPLPYYCWTYVRVSLYRFALYASRRQLRALPGGGGGVMRNWMDSEFAFYASRRRLRAWPEGGLGGVRSWTEIFLSNILKSPRKPHRGDQAGSAPSGGEGLVYTDSTVLYGVGTCYRAYLGLPSRGQ